MAAIGFRYYMCADVAYSIELELGFNQFSLRHQFSSLILILLRGNSCDRKTINCLKITKCHCSKVLYMTFPAAAGTPLF